MSVMREGIKINDDGSINVTFASGSTIDSPTFTGVVKGASSILGKWGTAFIYAASGTMGNNGALTLGTALPRVYPNAYVYLPASAISAGSAAGWYFAQFSSTTVGTVFNNTYTSGVPLVPVSPIPFSTTGPGAYASDNVTHFGPSITVPAGSLGANGFLDFVHSWEYTNSAGSKTPQVNLNGSGGTLIFQENGVTTNLYSACHHVLANAGDTGHQIGQALSIARGSGGFIQQAPTTASVNTASAMTIDFGFTKSGPTDNLVLIFAKVLAVQNGA